MRRIYRAACLAIAAFLVPAAAHAQYAATQDSTLVGVKKVYVNFTDANGVLGQPNAEQLANGVALELRKSGLRVVHSVKELTNDDAILNVSVLATPRARTSDVSVRMDVEQVAQLQRTKQTLRMVTWYYEENASNAVVADAAPAMLGKGVNEFLAKWMDMNGR